ncbi:MAG: hypothetical protein C7B47_15540 [Sulfobacillus thermosulfidooxidans]|uniref:Uncharacterized protein n=1 Tax=Sulfobacillus thermosulfidooxidans TaxID=28034 RepID=A0A2T2WP57_SULTH|nr:MAG: hypothetical protein C7B47_15540 [Sulfobacillus thermosulfidooxidans]
MRHPLELIHAKLNINSETLFASDLDREVLLNNLTQGLLDRGTDAHIGLSGPRYWLLPPAELTDGVITGETHLIISEKIVRFYKDRQEKTTTIEDAVDQTYVFALDIKSEHMVLQIPRSIKPEKYFQIMAKLIEVKAANAKLEVGRLNITPFPRKLDRRYFMNVRVTSARFKLVAPNSPDHGAIRTLRQKLTKDRILNATIFVSGEDISPDGLISEGIDMAESGYATYEIRGKEYNGQKFHINSESFFEKVVEDVDDEGNLSTVLESKRKAAVRWLLRILQKGLF